MIVEDKPALYPGEPWGFDNGAFIHWQRKEAFDEAGYLRRLERAYSTCHRPYLAVLPDIVAGGEASLDYSLEWLARLPREWPWYLALQDGMSEASVRQAIRAHHLAGLFLGGTDRFKGTAYGWKWLTRESENRCRFHYARAGTIRKLRHAKRIGADSLDSAFPLWTEARFTAFARQWAWADTQRGLW